MEFAKINSTDANITLKNHSMRKVLFNFLGLLMAYQYSIFRKQINNKKKMLFIKACVCENKQKTRKDMIFSFLN